MKVREFELMVWMKKRMTVMKKDDKTLSLCGGRTGEESPTGCQYFSLVVFFFGFFSICLKCVVMDNADMNYLKVICEMKVMPV